MFGYDPSVSWKISSIKPSEAKGCGGNGVLSGPQGQQAKLYVTPDGKHALIGDIIPFGAHPFAAARRNWNAA